MKNFKNVLLMVLIAVSLNGCFSDENAENNLLDYDQVSYSLSSSENLPTGIYYTFRKDYRKCMAPRCGGYWLKAVNVPETVCADGTIGGEAGCYVAGFDRNEIELKTNDIVIGKFRKQRYGSVLADHLDLSSAFSPITEDLAPRSDIFLVQDSGIQCVTTPCISKQIATVNTDKLEHGAKVKFAIKNRLLQNAQKKAFRKAYKNGGALVQGELYEDSKKKKILAIIEVYTRKESVIQESYCTFMKEANDNTFIAWNVKSYEQGKLLLSGANFEQGTEDIVEGRCEDYSSNCPRLWRPVCGTIFETGETKTYGNVCTFSAAIRRVAGKDDKAKGSWTVGKCPGEVGDYCGGRMGYTCKEGLFCKYEMKEMCGASDLTGTCSEYAEICPMIYKPVCGCDGRDYSNECVAWSHGVSAAYDGRCKN